MKKRFLAGGLGLLLILSLILMPLSGCTKAVDEPAGPPPTEDPAAPNVADTPADSQQPADLMTGVVANNVQSDADLKSSARAAIADFGIELFRKSITAGENSLISPLSVLCALAMTANGADGETLAQMERVFGLSVRELNEYLHTYTASLPTGEKYKFSLANSIWFRDTESLVVREDFLQRNADYYGAALYKAPFNNDTLKKINRWVNDNTDGMIEKIIDEISGDTVMYLINALAFDAEWENVYIDDQIGDDYFTTEPGHRELLTMMYSTEGVYLDDGKATGFMKYYADKKYALVALLPNEGTTVEDYIGTLTGEGIMNMLDGASYEKVYTKIPKFESDYSITMVDILKSMGMTDAFSPADADLSGIGSSADGNLFISNVIHKTYISVDEKGTKAAAVTGVIVDAMSIEVDPTKTVYLERPFVYMLIDCETNLPFFIGTMME